MDTTLRYESSNGEVLRFAADQPFHYGDTTLHDYQHDYTALGGKIVGFSHGIREFDLNIIVTGADEGERDRIIEALEHDVQTMQPGRLYSGDYYIRCYCTESSKDMWWFDDGHMHAKLKFVSDEGVWVREEYKLFKLGEVGGTGIDYAHDWGFDYVSNVMIQDITNTNFVAAPFKLNVFGPVADPISIKIGEYTYAVNTTLAENEVLTIDGRMKSITKRAADGTEESLFAARVGDQRLGSGYYVFQPVESGYNFVSWSATYSFDLTLYDERSEPRWS